MLRRVVLPASLPSIFTGLRIGLGIGWTAVIVAEMVAVKSGLGYVLWDAYYVGRMDVVIADMVSIGLLGLRQRPRHPADRALGAELAPPAILPVLRQRHGHDHLQARFEDLSAAAEDVRALDDVSLTVGEGEFVALLGPSGCGKSTLLNLLAGFEKPDQRRRCCSTAQPITRPGPDRGVVFQEAALFPWLTVWENVVFGPQRAGRAASRLRAAAREIARAGRARVAFARRCRCSCPAACASASASPAFW